MRHLKEHPVNYPTPRSDGWFLRFIYFLVGVDTEILARCPQRDRGNILTIGYLLIGVWFWQLIVVSVALHVGLAQPGEFRAEFVGLAALVATLVLLFDSYLVRASWETTGLEQLNRAGMRIPMPWSAKLKNVAFMGVRAGVTVLLALLTGSLMSLMLFSKDVEKQLAAAATEKNSPLVQAIGRRFDTETRRLEAEREQQLAAIAKADADGSALRQSVLNQIPVDPEIGLVTDRVRDILRRREAAERRLTQVSAVARDASGSTRVAIARRNLDALNRDVAAAQERLSALQNRRDGAAQRLTGTADGRLKDTKAVRDAAELRVRTLDAAIAKRTESREASIRDALVRDPGYASPDDGLLSRLKALKALTADPFIFWTVLLLDAVFVAIELAAVLSKVMTFVPAAYALKLAVETVKLGHGAREELAKLLGLDLPPPPASPTGSPASGAAEEHGPSPDRPVASDRDSESDGHDKPDGRSDTNVDDLDDRLFAGARAAQARQNAMDKAKAKAASGKGNTAVEAKAPGAPDQHSAPFRRGPGRPPGSPNKPKANGVAPPETSEE